MVTLYYIDKAYRLTTVSDYIVVIELKFITNTFIKVLHKHTSLHSSALVLSVPCSNDECCSLAKSRGF